MLISEPERFLNSILEFCDFTSAATGFGDRIASNRINSRKSILELCMRRLANKIFRTQLSNYGFKAITRRQLNAGFKRLSPYFPVVKAIENRQDLKARSVIRRTIMNRYRRSNSDLSQMLGMDLGYYGYDTESSANWCRCLKKASAIYTDPILWSAWRPQSGHEWVPSLERFALQRINEILACQDLIARWVRDVSNKFCLTYLWAA